MRLLLAPNAFKGTFGAVRVARIWESALRGAAGVETVSRPLSDGGDGALEVWEGYLEDADRVWFVARDPLGAPRRTPVLWHRERRSGHVETALACGLAQLPPDARDPLRATTDGCGQLLAGLLGLGAAEVVLALGGSATVDGGLGLGRALGYRFRARGGGEIERPAELERLDAVEAPAARPWKDARVIALTDVRAPLLGDGGAVRVFGPQKFPPGRPVPEGALALLERGLRRLADVLARDLGADVRDLPGAGAAGGLGAGLVALAGAELRSGAAHFLELSGVPRLLTPASPGVEAAVTGEGSYDEQSGRGKLSGELRALCAAARVPLAVIAGAAGGASCGELVLTGADLRPPVRDLDEEALARLAVEAARRLQRPPHHGVAAFPTLV